MTNPLVHILALIPGGEWPPGGNSQVDPAVRVKAVESCSWWNYLRRLLYMFLKKKF